MKHIPIMIISVIMFSTLGAGLAAQKSKTELVYELKGSDLPGNLVEALPEGFDISPDRSQIAAVFETADTVAPKTFGIWIAAWDLSTRKLLNKVEIEGPISLEQLAIPGAARDLRYTPAGDALVVQTGLALFVVRADNFAKILTVHPMYLPTNSSKGTLIEGFDISGDGSRLAVLTRTGYDSRPIAGIQLIDLSNGRVDGQWTTPDSPSSIALSPNGSQILLSGLGDAGTELGEVRLVNARTGNIRRSFKSGCVYLAACGASDARFWGEGRIVVVPKLATDARGNSMASDMRIFDVESGQLIRTLKRQRFQSMGKLTMADNVPIVLTVSAWETSGEVIGEQWFHHSKPELVAFNLDDGTSRTVIRPVSRGQGGNTVDQYSLRISHDGSLVALFHDRAIRIYRLASSALPLKK